MKKTVCLFLFFIFSLTACVGKEPPKTPTTAAPTTETSAKTTEGMISATVTKTQTTLSTTEMTTAPLTSNVTTTKSATTATVTKKQTTLSATETTTTSLPTSVVTTALLSTTTTTVTKTQPVLSTTTMTTTAAKTTTTSKATVTSSVTTTAKPTTTRTLDLSKPSTGVTGPKQAAYAQAIILLDESAYSYQGLVNALKYLGFAEEYATFAADTCGADWNKQAARRAQYHLDGMGYDTKSIINLLIGEGFTETQVAYALEANNL